jgi:plastocyanin
VITDSVLNLVELYNKLGKEIGIKTWAKWGTGDDVQYPAVGHPFADYWGNWVETECDGQPCCFTMGGCGPSRPYPPTRQTPIDSTRGDIDPSLAFDLSDYGHLGYDPALGPPDPNGPVQDQYTGTWETYLPPSDNPGVGQLLAKHVINAAINPMVHISGELEEVMVGESVTWETHVVSGTPGYTYKWSIKQEGATEWTTKRENSSTWTWNPGSGDAGTYDIQCKVTDSQNHTGEVIWEGFVVSEF